jgi:hypothetical protein
MSQSSYGLSFLFAYLSCSFHNRDLVFYQIGLSSVYHLYLTLVLVTTWFHVLFHSFDVFTIILQCRKLWK